MSISLMTFATACAARTAAHSSRRGILVVCKGATLDWPNSSAVQTFPLLSTWRRYMAAPIAFLLASENA